jgi:hypothetical protein
MDCWLTFNSKNDQSTGFQAVDLIWWVMTSLNSNSLLDELMCRAHFDSAEPHLIWSHGLLIDLICYICIWSEWLLYNANSAFSFSYFEVQAYVCREITNYICNLQIPNLITDSVNMQIYHYDSKQLTLILALDKRFAISV